MSRALTEYFKDKKTLILGFGREGRATLAFLRAAYPETKFYIADKRQIECDDKNVETFCGDDYLAHINDFDLVMQSPGITLRDVEINPEVEVTGEMDLFLRFADCFKIGVTGTKGKTTTTTLIYEMLRADGIPAVIMGNIGIPVFDCLDDAEGCTAVIEMSCHQLEFCRSSPDIAVLTNLYPEHLDHYNGFEGYANAKMNIARFQDEGSVFISNKDQPLEEIVGDLSDLKADRILVAADDYEGDSFLTSLTKLSPKLFGKHHFYDVLCAVAAARCFGVSDRAIAEAVKNFRGIPHRMELFAEKNGIKFYDDAIATAPFAVMSAVEALKSVGTLILGGLDRGLDYSGFVNDLAAADIDCLVCMPDTGNKIADELKKLGTDKRVFKAATLAEAVRLAFENTKSGKSCILSPAAASYNEFRDFEEKGNAFQKLVKDYDG